MHVRLGFLCATVNQHNQVINVSIHRQRLHAYDRRLTATGRVILGCDATSIVSARVQRT